MGYLRQILLICLAASTVAIRRKQFYPYGPSTGQKTLRAGDSQQGSLVSRVAVTLYNTKQTSFFVHTDGFVKFEHTPAGEQPYDFNEDLADSTTMLIAPFLADLDTNAGGVWYGDLTEEQDLLRARNDIHRYVDADFKPKSVFVFTWEDVFYKGTSEYATFQLALSTNGSTTYAIFMYEDTIEEPKSTLNYPQAGVTLGDGYTYFILPESGSSNIYNLYRDSNIGQAGVFVYDLGQLSSSQDGSGTGDTESFLTTTTPVVSNEGDDCTQCSADAQCARFTDGFCCECYAGYIGNGISCLHETSDIRVSGYVNGTINGIELVDLDLHTFGVIREGRAYVAISPIQEDLGLIMQLLSTIGEFMGWMFSLVEGESRNGFQLTGGKLTRLAYISVDGGYDVRISQNFLGFDDEGQLHVNTVIEGTLPSISESAGPIVYSVYKEIYERKEPGRIRSVSSRDIEFIDFTISYRIDQTIVFEECTADEKDSSSDSMSLTITQQYTTYDSDPEGGILRFAISSKISKSDETVGDPCASNNCHELATCNSRGIYYICECNVGYEGDGRHCSVIDVCANIDCGDEAVCNAFDNGYQCVCNKQGYVWDAFYCRGPCDYARCASNSYCQEDNGNAQCICIDGFRKDRDFCVETPVGNPCDFNTCDQYAGQCISLNSKYATCECLDGFEGDGYVCEDIDECIIQVHDCHTWAKCENYQGGYNCICLPGYQGDGRTCTAYVSRGEGNVVFAQGNSLMNIPLNGDAGHRVIMQSRQTMVGVGYDCTDDYIYWTDINSKSISRVRSDGTGHQVVINRGLLSPEGVAIDWISRNMYWTDSGYHRIEVANLDGSHRRTLIDIDLKYPRAIAVDPVGGKLYWTDWSRSNPKIETSSLDGSDRSILVDKNIKLPNGLTIDHNSQQICWADAGTHKIECMYLDDVYTRFTVTSQATYAFSLTVHSNVFYWTDWQSQRIENIDKNSDTLGTPLKPSVGGAGRLYGIIATSACPAGTNACAYNNGDCNALCLPRPGRDKTCTCGHNSAANEIPCEAAP